MFLITAQDSRKGLNLNKFPPFGLDNTYKTYNLKPATAKTQPDYC
jgi:hypothetical protein